MRHGLEVVIGIIAVLSGLGVAYLAPGPKKLLHQTFWMGIALAAIGGFLLVSVW